MSASTYAHAKLCSATPLGTAETTIVSNGAAPQVTTVRLIIVHNTDAANPVDVELFTPAPAGSNPGAAALANRFHKLSLKSGDTAQLEYPAQGMQLDLPGDSLKAKASLAGVVTIQVHGGRE